MNRKQGKQMSNARIDRMVRELNSEPSTQFFQRLFGLGDSLPEPKAAARKVNNVLVSMPKGAFAR
jgi:hypothetical protein